MTTADLQHLSDLVTQLAAAVAKLQADAQAQGPAPTALPTPMLPASIDYPPPPRRTGRKLTAADVPDAPGSVTALFGSATAAPGPAPAPGNACPQRGKAGPKPRKVRSLAEAQTIRATIVAQGDTIHVRKTIAETWGIKERHVRRIRDNCEWHDPSYTPPPRARRGRNGGAA